MRALIVYATKYGQTGKIAERIASALRERGHEADLVDIAHTPWPDPTGYGAILLGGSVYIGRHSGPLVQWAKVHRRRLDRSISGFFSVSLAATDAPEISGHELREHLESFVARAGWRPLLARHFAGALPYTKYGPFLRLLMRFASHGSRHSTDTRLDHEYTDWAAVDRFADEIAGLMSAREPPRKWARLPRDEADAAWLDELDVLEQRPLSA